MRPKILLVTTCRWLAPARLALALRKAGHDIEAVCPPNHALTHTAEPGQIYLYDPFRPLDTFRRAITSGRPELVIPCDDLATAQLHRLHAAAEHAGQFAGSIRATLERSLGPPATYPYLVSRSRFISAVRELGVDAPETVAVTSFAALTLWLDKHGFPAVLKADGTSGGVGVVVVSDRKQAERAFKKLNAPPLAARAVKRSVCNGDRTLLIPCLRRERQAVSVQRYLSGREVTCTAATWKGGVLAHTMFEVLQTSEPQGPASVLRRIHLEPVALALEKIARHFHLSNLCGFDFILDSETSRAYLIEINPRATQTTHLALGPGHDLPAALYAALRSEPVRNTASVTEEQVVILFPHEWRRDPASSLLKTGYHDVPWEAPELVRLGSRGLYRRNARKAREELWQNSVLGTQARPRLSWIRRT